MEGVKGYKAFRLDWTCSPTKKSKQYACPGKFEEDVRPIARRQGMHFCTDIASCFDYYEYNPQKTRIAEVIAYGDVDGYILYCTNKLEILREVPWEEVDRIVNIGKRNLGFNNVGDDNKGKKNVGLRNDGNFNVGSNNTGDRNTGGENIGGYNAGDGNVGTHNTGSFNEGNNNSGDYNKGYGNSGNHNIGNSCTGEWNTASNQTGCFMTKESTIMLFDKPSPWTWGKWITSKARCILYMMPERINLIESDNKDFAPGPRCNPNVIDPTLNRQRWWNNLSIKDKEIVKSIPNFDAEIFRECTGINVNEEE